MINSDITDQAAFEKMSMARSWLVFHKPFWGVLSLTPILVEDRTCLTGWTNGEKLGYNPEMINALTLQQVATFIAHETGGHIGLLHQFRRGDRDHRMFNVAADYAVNLILEEDGFEPIDGWLLDKSFQGMTAEAIYSMLDPCDYLDTLDPGSAGEIRDAPDMENAEANGSAPKAAILETKARIAQAASVAKAVGKLSSTVERVIQEQLNPVLDWRIELLRFAKQIQQNDYSWQKPNRRYLSGGLYMPTLHAESAPHIIVAVDTSGSVSDEELKVYTTEIQAVKDELKSKITVLFCDTEVRDVKTFDVDQRVEMEIQGGGGTDFRPPFEWVDENLSVKPAGMLYFTDGYCSSFPRVHPEYLTLWLITENDRFQPPFGEAIRVKIA